MSQLPTELVEYFASLTKDTEVAYELAKQARKQGYDPDSPSFTQAMCSEHVEEWIKACTAELNELHARGAWTEMNRNDLPPNANLLPGTWAFKIKCFPDG